MKKNPTFQSGLFNSRILLAFLFCAVAALLGTLSFHSFATPMPPSGTLTPTNDTITYTDTIVTNATGVVTTPVCTVPNTCSDFVLTVNAQSVAATKQILIQGT